MLIVLASLSMKFDFFGTLLIIKKKIERLFGFDFCVVFEYGLTAIWGLMNSNVDDFSFFVDKMWFFFFKP